MHAETDELAIVVMNSGTLLNRHPSTVDTHGITDNPNCPSYTSILSHAILDDPDSLITFSARSLL